MRLLLILTLFVSACTSAPTPTPEPKEVVMKNPEVTEQEVEFKAAGMTVYGTLTMPAGEGKVPGVMLIAGSGPTDRNWENPLLPGTNGSARLLAKELADAGIAVLRYDKRGTGKTGIPPKVTWPDYMAEQNAGLDLLRANPRVQKIYLAGHSEGGAHAIKLANSGIQLDGVILLSTAGRRLLDILVWQIDKQLATLDDRTRQAHAATLTIALEKIAAGEPVDTTTASAYPGVQQLVGALQAPDAIEFGSELLGFDPLAEIAKTKQPILIISGQKDIQVDPIMDAQELARAAQQAELNYKFHLSPNADHVLKEELRPMNELDAAVGLKYNVDGRVLATDVVPTIVEYLR